MKALFKTVFTALKGPAGRYVVAGGTAYLVELAAIWWLVNGLNASPAMSVSISFWIGLVLSFVLQKFFAFGNVTMRPKVITKQVVGFGLLVLFNYLFTVAVVWLLEPILGVFIARTLALLVTVSWNYLVFKDLLFRSDAKHRP